MLLCLLQRTKYTDAHLYAQAILQHTQQHTRLQLPIIRQRLQQFTQVWQFAFL